MKTKTLLSVLAFGFFVSAFGQKPTMELTFAAENNGQYVPLDSILIENLTQGGDTILYAPDTILVFDYITSIGDNKVIGNNSFSVLQNYPNPFNGKTTVNLVLPQKDNIKITVRDILGRELAYYENTLYQGGHSFAFYSGNEKSYLFTVTGKQTSKTIKMLDTGNNTTKKGKCSLAYNGYENNMIGYKSYKAINAFVFNIGDELKYIAYTDVEETELIDSPTSSQIYTFQFDGWTPCPGSSVVTDIDGNTYNTVQIGDQCWMKENLRTTTYQNGTQIPNVADGDVWSNLTTGAYVWYNNDISMKQTYGAMYNWYTTVDNNGLCPIGWHVPTNDEWIILIDFIGGTSSPHGNELKSCRQVNSPLGGGCNTTEHPRWNEYYCHWGTDDYNFSGLPGGVRCFDGTFYFIGNYGVWWTSTESSSDDAWGHGLYFGYGHVGEYNDSKRRGFSVRCLRD